MELTARVSLLNLETTIHDAYCRCAAGRGHKFDTHRIPSAFSVDGAIRQWDEDNATVERGIRATVAAPCARRAEEILCEYERVHDL